MGAAAWLLVFLGPIGWLALMILMGGGRGTGREILSIQLPYSDEAWTRHAKRKRWRTYAGILCVTALVAGLFSVGGLLYSGWFVLAGIFFLAALVAHLLLTFDEVDITLDATRRWLTLHNVHESFVAALNTTPSRTPEL
jgi:hypothetical protein